MGTTAPEQFSFAIDRGGTFTDIYAICPNGKTRVMKLLSEDPTNYEDAPREGIRRIIESETGIPMPKDQPIDPKYIEWIRMGTTVATNALLEEKGEPLCLLVTEGFKDILFIGNQARPRIFDLKIQCPEVLYKDVIEVEERVVLRQADCQINKPSKEEACKIVQGVTGEKVEIWKSLNQEKLISDLTNILASGIKSIVVALLHAYLYPEHERIIEQVALKLGFENVTLSSSVMPMIKLVPRGITASVDGYLTPHIRKYIKGFGSGFKGEIDCLKEAILFMQSDGGLTPVSEFSGSKAILSGPAGGVVGYAMTTIEELGSEMPVIGFDMGGTSTDVSRYGGLYEHTFESTTAGVTIQAPQLDINTVAAGGGSILTFRSGLFAVGPESASAYPGPVCYRNGGPLAVTDANLVLGRILPECFPKIFGPSKDQPLDKEASYAAFAELTKEVNEFLQSTKGTSETKSVEEVAMGFIRVANEAMCRPIRAITEGKGYDTSKHVLACFGGAGGQHACSMARDLGIKTVFIHKYAGILSAYGMALADVVHEETKPVACEFNEANYQRIDDCIKELSDRCTERLMSQGFSQDRIELEIYLNLRYRGTDFPLMCLPMNREVTSLPICSRAGFIDSFIARYKREFGFVLKNREILVDDVRIRGIGKTSIKNLEQIQNTSDSAPEPMSKTKCYFEEGYVDTLVFDLSRLHPGQSICGPSIIIDANSTILVEPGCKAEITQRGNVRIEIGSSTSSLSSPLELDPIQLSIFSHRFMSIAEQMGRILQRTSISTNIKERLDFSCALFGPDGGLVSNAPHIPVHLGSMQHTVQYQIESTEINPGDVILSNHPQAGGSHLPDLTVITPVFHEGESKPIFFVASRGHHADIGGATPGSMPPHSKSIHEEGACFMSFKLVKEGVFQEDALIEQLMAPGNYPGCSGTRALSDNISDLKAQVAANQRGITLVSELVQQYGLNVVQRYMKYIQENAEQAVRDMLKEVSKRNSNELFSEDCMDDGTLLRLHVKIDASTGSAVFDFSGTGLEVYGNTNAPRAITLSAIIYCLRSMIPHDIPLNQGCLSPISIIIPEGCLLNPSKDAAVVGGNVLTSQRVVDVVFKAFEVTAASQGCMNNITFGDSKCTYYETVAGGAGAGPGWHGRSAIHTHMTNTRITDPEIIEKRYPVIVRKFCVNPGTGGAGLFDGGNGVIRELLFRRNLVLSVLTERRVFSPYGLKGGQPGEKGHNELIYKEGRIVNLGSKNSVKVTGGDVFRLRTPGGGGYGSIETPKDFSQGSEGTHRFREYTRGGGLHDYQMRQESA